MLFPSYLRIGRIINVSTHETGSGGFAACCFHKPLLCLVETYRNKTGFVYVFIVIHNFLFKQGQN